ncbi:MAG: hypothetical protein RL141_1111 [Candidatus Parcubacteria bacterium]
MRRYKNPSSDRGIFAVVGWLTILELLIGRASVESSGLSGYLVNGIGF